MLRSNGVRLRFKSPFFAQKNTKIQIKKRKEQ